MWMKLLKERTESTEVRSGYSPVQEISQTADDVTAELQMLRAAKQQAVENEVYEEAAALKHRIEYLEKRRIHTGAVDSVPEDSSSASKCSQKHFEHEASHICLRQGARRGAWAAFVERRIDSNDGTQADKDITVSRSVQIRTESSAIGCEHVDVNAARSLQSTRKIASLNLGEGHETESCRNESGNGHMYSLNSDGSWGIECDNDVENLHSNATRPLYSCDIDSRTLDKASTQYFGSAMAALDDELNACCTSSDSDKEHPNQFPTMVTQDEQNSRCGNREYARLKSSDRGLPDDKVFGHECEEKSEKAAFLVRLRRHVHSVAEKDFPRALEQVSDALLAALEEDVYVACMLLRLRSELQRNNGNFDEALADCNEWVELAPESGEALIRRAIARLQVGGNDTEALRDLRRAEALGIGNMQVRQFQRWLRRAQYWISQPSRPNHYYALGAPIEASHDTLKRAYRCALLRWHPDKPGGDAARFRTVQEAWDVLSDYDQRKFYDFGTLGAVDASNTCGVDLRHRARAAYPFRADASNQAKARPKNRQGHNKSTSP